MCVSVREKEKIVFEPLLASNVEKDLLKFCP